MSNRIFTKEQVQGLLKNPHVMRCSERSVTYTSEFKILAVKRYREDGLSSSRIFAEAGFDLDVLGDNTPDRLMSRWKEIHASKGNAGLSVEQRGRSTPPRVKHTDDTNKIKWLEARVAYLKAENDFLAKLRAKRKE